MENKVNLKKLLKKAEKGDVDAIIYFLNVLSMQSPAEAEKLDIRKSLIKFEKAIAADHNPVGYIMLAQEYVMGNYISKDISKAIKLYEEAVEEGAGFGNECLGLLYYEGKEVPQDYAKALEYFTKDEGRKSASTNYSLAEMYRQGLGVEQDLGKAFDLYALVVDDDSPYAEMDDYYPRACFRLAQMLHATKDPEDCREALRLLKLSKDRLLNRSKEDVPTGISKEEVLEEWDSLNA